MRGKLLKSLTTTKIDSVLALLLWLDDYQRGRSECVGKNKTYPQIRIKNDYGTFGVFSFAIAQ